MIWPSISNLNRYLWLQGPNATFPGLDKVQCLLKWTRFDYHQQPSRVSISQFHRRSSFPLSLLANSFPRLFATRTCWGDAASTGAWSTSQNLPPSSPTPKTKLKKKRRAGAPGSEMARLTSSRKRWNGKRGTRKGETQCSPPWLPRDAEISNPKTADLNREAGSRVESKLERPCPVGGVYRGPSAEAEHAARGRGWGCDVATCGERPKWAPLAFVFCFGVRSKSMEALAIWPDLSPRIRCGLTGPWWVAVPPRRSDPLAMWVAMGLGTSWAEICLAVPA